MLFELWHHWMLLRPLLVFALAGPLIVIAVLFRGPRQPRGAESEAPGAPVSPSAPTGGHPEPGPKHRLIETSPRQWHLDRVGSDRRAA